MHEYQCNRIRGIEPDVDPRIEPAQASEHQTRDRKLRQMEGDGNAECTGQRDAPGGAEHQSKQPNLQEIGHRITAGGNPSETGRLCPQQPGRPGVKEANE